MSHRGNRHQRRPSQSHFVLPDNLTDPFPAKPDAADQARAAAGVAAAAGVPLPAPPAKPSGEAKLDEKVAENPAAKAKAGTGNVKTAGSE